MFYDKKVLLFLTPVFLILLLFYFYSKGVILKGDADFICRDCNVILIGIDTLRADHLGAYGYSKDISPNIDNLARSGAIFKKNFSQSITTTPSFMSLFTSLYPTDHGILYTWGALSGVPNVMISEEIKTLPEILKFSGYKTHAFMTSPALSAIFGFSRGFDDFSVRKIKFQRKKLLDLLSKKKKEKFFIFYHDLTPHAPYNSDEKAYVKTGSDKVSIPSKDYFAKVDPSDPSQVKKLINDYDEGVKDVDNFIGLLIKTLEKENLLKNTIVVFMSDHGEELLDHGALGHDEFYNEVVHVPLIFSVPLIKTPVEVNAITRSIDIMPTILALLDIKAEIPMRGISLLNLIANPDTDLGLPAISIMGESRSITMEGYKYIDQTYFQPNFNKPTTLELFELNIDWNEKNNLINKNLPIKKRLINLYTEEVNNNKYSKKPVVVGENKWDQKTIENLKSLGY